MSRAPRDSSSSRKQNEFGPNYLGYYKHLVLDLFSQNEHSIIPFLEGSEVLEASGACDHDKGRKNKNFSDSLSYFTGRVGEGLSEFKKERLTAVLNDYSTCLNEEVDKILDHIIATSQIDSDVRGKELLPFCSAASDGQTTEPHCSKKRKASHPISNNSGSSSGVLAAESVRQLDKLQQDLEEFLNVVVSKCRSKHYSGRMMHNPQTNDPCGEASAWKEDSESSTKGT